MDFECRIRRADGALRWIRTSRNMHAMRPATLGKSPECADITERKNGAQELHEIQQRLQGV